MNPSCPFCGAAADDKHTEDCWVMIDVDAGDEVLATAWSRRAPQMLPGVLPIADQQAQRDHTATCAGYTFYYGSPAE